MVIKCGLCERQLKISRTHFVDVFYACKLENLNILEKDINDATVNSSGKVKRVTETNTCFDFGKEEVKVYAMEVRSDDDL